MLPRSRADMPLLQCPLALLLALLLALATAAALMAAFVLVLQQGVQQAGDRRAAQSALDEAGWRCRLGAQARASAGCVVAPSAPSAPSAMVAAVASPPLRLAQRVNPR